jgi:hypothetical protein
MTMEFRGTIPTAGKRIPRRNACWKGQRFPSKNPTRILLEWKLYLREVSPEIIVLHDLAGVLK